MTFTKKQNEAADGHRMMNPGRMMFQLVGLGPQRRSDSCLERISVVAFKTRLILGMDVGLFDDAGRQTMADIVLLTLVKHAHSIWITYLHKELELLGKTVHIVTLESILNGDSNPIMSAAKLIVNRVSDAADPHLYKACLGVLLSAGYHTKIWNGPISFAQCGSKWCHHEILEQATLKTPVTRRIYPATKERVEQSCRELQKLGHKFPFLLKPNAGGFGAGIVRIASEEQLTNLDPSTGTDPVALVQVYIPPAQEKIYRIWFLRGKVQCGITRTNQEGADEFTTGCAANGLCDLNEARKLQPIISAVVIQSDVVTEIQESLLHLLKDAHCGSVEYLEDSMGQRYYFDVNLLSTLPLVDTVMNAKEIWGKDYNPWKELASAMVNYIDEN